ncbi:hypothetical protein ID866_10019 [Astraeus odoratus]|nr:hypothetical protein ID866_10019 [Astraeus odoratus]
MSPRIEAYTHANNIPETVWGALRAQEARSNVIYPFALKAKEFGQNDTAQLWLAYFNGAGQVTFVLSCTRGDLGDYPIFIVTSIPYAECQDEVITGPLVLLAKELRSKVQLDRVFAVFAYAPVAHMFATVWQDQTNVARGDEYYRAAFGHCTRASFMNAQEPRTLPSDRSIEVWLGRAEARHTEQVADLCFQFAETSEPYTLTRQQALQEANSLISRGQVWIHLIRENSEDWDAACIVAATRQSANISTITKVFTNPEKRKLGCAERLLRRVCKEIFTEKRGISLFVGTSNSAANVYRRVGFAGLGTTENQMEGVEIWLEIGFDKSKVKLGHW